MAEAPPQEDFSKLSIEDKLGHKVWKARLMGYEEATKLFKRIDDEESPQYTPYIGLVKKFPVESNAVAQEKALEATLAFVECASAAGKICSDVIGGVVTKCLNARPKTKEMGVSICLMYVEIEKQDIVLEEVLKGISNKQPKIVAGSIATIRQIVQEFGGRVLNMKILLKAVPSMFDHSDKNVRAEAKSLAIELYRWVGVALKASIDGKIKPIQMKELEEEFEKLPGEPPKATRLLRSQQQVAVPEAIPTEEGGATGGAVAMVTSEPAIDPYDLMEAVNVLGQMPKDFYEKIADTKWKERKEALDALLPLAQSPKIEEGDFNELLKVLKKIITKDSNVLVVALAGNVITGLAKGLRKKFGPYASSCLAAMFEKFKEKKANVVTSLREACDATFLTTTLANVQDDTLEALNNKNPSVKAEVLLFLSRCYSQCVAAMLPKPYLKTACPAIVQRLDDTNPQVRDAACEVLGTLLKVLGDRPMNPYTETIDKTKMTKIVECREKVELKAPPPGMAPAVAPPSAPVAKQPAETKKEEKQASSDDSVPMKKKPAKKVVKPKTGTAADDKPKETPPTKKSAASSSTAEKKAPPSGGGAAKSKGKGGGAVGKFDEPPDVPEANISAEELDDKANEVLPAGLLDKLSDPAWKERLAGHESFKEFAEGQSPDDIQCILYVKVLGRKPGWKDSNFQVMKSKFELVKVLAEKAKVFGKKTMGVVIPPLVDKFSDIKVKGQCSDTLLMISERMTLNYTSLQVMKAAFEHKSPKVQSESMEWLNQGLKEFGFLINVKPHIDYVKKGLAATNPAVRTATINLLGTMCMFMGAQLRMFFDGEKPALLQQIDAVFEKSSGETPPAPIRGPNVRTGDEEEGEGEGGGDSGGGAQAVSLADLMPKVDISGQITGDLIKELSDKNWKIRGESLQKVQDIIAAAKFIQPSLGDLPSALKGRLGDSNKNLVMTTLTIISSLSTAMGSSCNKFNKIFIPNVIQTFGDSKPQVRAAGVACLSAWVGEVGVACVFEQDLIAPCLATDNPNLRTELLGWLEVKLPECGTKLPSETQSLVQPLYQCLEDRSAEVRKKAQLVLPLLMVPVGYETMIKHTGKLKPASKQLVKGLLDKHRASLAPAEPAPKTSSAKKTAKEETTSSPSKEDKTPPTKTAKGRSAGGGKASKGGGASEDDEKPLILVPKAKEQRAKDDEKLKLLKWNFQMPRPEHIDQLKDQLLTCVSLSLHKKLFHEDFKQQLQAVAILQTAVANDIQAGISCSDLLLRWVTLRFSDTNTTVNMKCLELVQILFEHMTTEGYRMSDYEGGSFLPYLVIKVGDPKEPVRKLVRNLFRVICSLYPPGKLFTYVIEGLKSKNARQRTECLEVLGEMIQNNGMVVCQPSPPKTLPLIAGQISDRDNGVRSAALNTMVTIYGYIGEGVYKYTSQLLEKEVSLLEERIKRSGKTVVQQQPSVAAVSKSKTPSPIPPSPEPNTARSLVRKSPSPTPSSPVPKATVISNTSPRSSSIPKFTGPFSLDMNRYRPPKGTGSRPRVPRPDLTPFDADEQIPELPTSKLIHHPPKPLSISPARTLSSSTSSVVSYMISQITSPELANVSKAITQLERMTLEQPSLLHTHIDQLMRAILMQKRLNFTTRLSKASSPEDFNEVLDTSRLLAGLLVQVFSSKDLAATVRQETLVELERDVFGYLIDDKLLCLENIAQLNRVYNVLMGHIVESSDRNAIFGSLFQVMLETLTPEGGGTKQSDMAMKCLWRLTRQLEQMLSQLNIDQLLKDIDTFFVGYAHLNPTPSQDDKPYRTIKTILYHLAKLMNDKILDHLSLIKDHTSSSVVQYLRKTVQKGSSRSNKGMVQEKTTPKAPPTKEEQPPTPKSNPLTRCELPIELSSHLTAIFETIKEPTTTRQGMEELYDVIQAHPEIDFESMWSSSTPFFHSYIKRGLKNIQQWRQIGNNHTAHPIESEDYERLRTDLEEVRNRATDLMGINWGPKQDRVIAKATPTDENKDPTRTTLITDGTATITKRKGPPPSSGGKEPAVTSSHQKLDDLRKRLDRLKGTS